MYPELIPAILAPLVFLFPRRWKVWAAAALIVAGSVPAMMAACACIAGAGDYTAAGAPGSSWGYQTFYGGELAAVDRLSSFFIIIICIGAISVTLYSKGYLARYIKEHTAAHLSLHYMCLVLLFFAMLGVVTCRGGYGFLACWELMTLTSFLLILFEAKKRETRRAAVNYLVMMHVGFVFLLAAFAAIGAKGLPVSFDSLRTFFADGSPLPLLLLFLVGFGMKAGLFPLHSWLPEAHPAAPAHISAFMSGVMINMGIYGVLRVTAYMQSGGLLAAGIILLAVGAATGIWGVLFAAVQSDVKRLLAYSTIENAGIIFMAIGAVLIGRSQNAFQLAYLVMSGLLLHIFNHSLFKTLLFFGAGNIYTATHTTSIEALGGLAKKMPVTAAMFLTGTLAICALPPLSGFVSEFMISYGFLGALKSGFADTVGSGTGNCIIPAICGMLALAFIGGVAILAFSKLYGVAFLGTPRTGAVHRAREVDGWRIAACAIPAAGVLAVGVAPMYPLKWVFRVTESVVTVDGWAQQWSLVRGDFYALTRVIAVFVGLAVLLYIVKAFALKGRHVAGSPTWGCGYGAPTPAMQYTGESFAEGLQSVVPPISGALKGDAPARGEIFPHAGSLKVERSDRVAGLFNAWWVELMRRANARVMRMRTGRVNHYILYALLFLLLILSLSVFDAI